MVHQPPWLGQLANEKKTGAPVNDTNKKRFWEGPGWGSISGEAHIHDYERNAEEQGLVRRDEWKRVEVLGRDVWFDIVEPTTTRRSTGGECKEGDTRTSEAAHVVRALLTCSNESESTTLKPTLLKGTPTR